MNWNGLGPNSVNQCFIVVTNMKSGDLAYVSLCHSLVLVIIYAKCDVEIFYDRWPDTVSFN